MGFEILLLPSKWVESGETGRQRYRGRFTGRDHGFVVNVDDKFLLVYRLPAKPTRAKASVSVDLDGGFCDRRGLFLTEGFVRTDSATGGSEGLKETRSGRG